MKISICHCFTCQKNIYLLRKVMTFSFGSVSRLVHVYLRLCGLALAVLYTNIPAYCIQFVFDFVNWRVEIDPIYVFMHFVHLMQASYSNVDSEFYVQISTNIFRVKYFKLSNYVYWNVGSRLWFGRIWTVYRTITAVTSELFWFSKCVWIFLFLWFYQIIKCKYNVNKAPTNKHLFGSYMYTYYITKCIIGILYWF